MSKLNTYKKVVEKIKKKERSEVISVSIIAISLLVFTFLFTPFYEIEKEDYLYQVDSEYYRGTVLEIIEEEIDQEYLYQKLEIKITEGSREGDVVTIDYRNIYDLDESGILKEGNSLVLLATEGFYEEGESIFVVDYSRKSGLFFALIVFLFAILYFGRSRGLGAICGLIFSFLVLIYYIIPNIVTGANTMQVTLIGVLIISGVSIFAAHGIGKKTNIIWISTVSTLLITIFLSYFFVEITHLFGRGDEISYSFQFGGYSHISLRGLLLAGLIVGVFGVLTDITSTQTAAIIQIKKANPKLGIKELYSRGIMVGREHIASLVNTLVLVYVGASLPLFIIITGNDYMPLWVLINNEFIAEEIIRAIIGSISLILAVPISSIFASYLIGKES